jgi:hypothetical protein
MFHLIPALPLPLQPLRSRRIDQVILKMIVNSHRAKKNSLHDNYFGYSQGKLETVISRTIIVTLHNRGDI